MLSQQGDALLLPFPTFASQSVLSGARKTARVGKLRNTQGCEGDRNLSQKLHKQGVTEPDRVQAGTAAIGSGYLVVPLHFLKVLT